MSEAITPSVDGPLASRHATLHHLTLCDSVRTTKVNHVQGTWNGLIDRFTSTPRVTADRVATCPRINLLGETVEGGPITWALFSPFQMLTAEEGAKLQERTGAYSRCIDNIISADLLVIDVDNDPKYTNLPASNPKCRDFATIEDVTAQLDGNAYIIYTSFNHLNPAKHGGVPKFRVILPLAEPVTYDELAARKGALKVLFPFADPASFVVSQPFFVPMVHPDRTKLHQATYAYGQPFDLLALDPPAKRAPATRAGTAQFVTTDELYSGLPFITLANRQTYRADELYAILKEGYDGRVSCFRIGAPDNKPGCFVFRKNNGLSYHDNDGGSRFIRVLRSKRVATVSQSSIEDDAPATLKLVTRARTKPPVAAPRELTRPEGFKPDAKSTLFLEMMPTGVHFHGVDQRYLPEDLARCVPATGLMFVRSPKGTGKSEMLKAVVDACGLNHESAALLGHRIFLLRNLANRCGLDHYLDLDDGDHSRYMAVCLNSLGSRLDPDLDNPYDTVIIDESEQVLQHLTSQIMQNPIKDVWPVFCWLIRNAKRVICLDADLTCQLTVDIIGSLRGAREDDAIVGVDNTYKIGAGKPPIKLYEDRWHMVGDLIAAIDEGHKVFMTCNDRGFATVINDIATKTCGKRCLLITSETSATDEAQAFIENPSEVSRSYDVICTSPTLATGVSIDGEHFTKVFGFFRSTIGTYQDADQAIARVRACDDVSVWVQGSNTPYSGPGSLISEEAIYADLLNAEKITTRNWTADLLDASQLEWANVAARLKYCETIWSRHKDIQFVEAKTAAGFELTPVLEVEEVKAVARSLYSEHLDAKVDRAPLVFDAEWLDDHQEISRIAAKVVRDRDEALALERYNIATTLRVSHADLTLDAIRTAIQQDLIYAIRRLRTLVANTDEQRLDKDRHDRETNPIAFTANKHRFMQRQLLDHLARSANLTVEGLVKAVQGDAEYEIGDDVLTNVAEAYHARRREFGYYFDARIANATSHLARKRVWDATFGKALCLYLVKKKRGSKGVRESKYFLDKAKRSQVHAAWKLEEGFFRDLSRASNQKEISS